MRHQCNGPVIQETEDLRACVEALRLMVGPADLAGRLRALHCNITKQEVGGFR
jgi:hypothetical protein